MSEDLAYITGLFDGEGTISLGRNSGSEFRRVEITLSSTDKCLCDLMRSILGFGNVYSKKSRKPDHWSQAYEYRISGDNALTAAALFLRYSRHPKKIARMRHVLDNHKRVTVRNGKYTHEQKIQKLAYEHEFFTL